MHPEEVKGYDRGRDNQSIGHSSHFSGDSVKGSVEGPEARVDGQQKRVELDVDVEAD